MSAYSNFFESPVQFTNGIYYLDNKYTEDEAAVLFQDRVGVPVFPYQMHVDSVRYGFAHEDVEGFEGGSCWYSGATGRGAKEVWAFDWIDK